MATVPSTEREEIEEREMTVVDLHPEELLDRSREGHDPRVADHLARCVACRFEQQVRADFAHEAPSARPPVSPPVASQPSPRRWWRARAAGVLAVVVLASVAAGVTALVGEDREPVVTAPAPPERAPRAVRALHVVSDTAVKGATAPAPAPAASPVADDARAIFEGANTSRRRRRYARALMAYRTLLDRFPRSAEARASRAVVGALLLDLGDTMGALSSFDTYLSAGAGELREEAMVGRATSLERMGRAGEAREAWGEIKRAFPASPYADHARQNAQPPRI